MKFTVYGKPNCRFCERTKVWLEIKQHEFDYISLDTPDKVTAFKEKNPTAKSVPQIYVVDETGERLVGGYTELVEMFQ